MYQFSYLWFVLSLTNTYFCFNIEVEVSRVRVSHSFLAYGGPTTARQVRPLRELDRRRVPPQVEGTPRRRLRVGGDAGMVRVAHVPR